MILALAFDTAASKLADAESAAGTDALQDA